RAAAWWARVYCPDIMLGLNTSDELEDMAAAPIETRVRAVAAALDAPDPQPVAGELSAGPSPQDMYAELVQARAAHFDADELRIWEDWAIGKPREQWDAADYERAIARMRRGEGLEGTGGDAKAGQ